LSKPVKNKILLELEFLKRPGRFIYIESLN
jgi:hypothetical protein